MFDSRDLLGAMLGSGMGGRNPRMGGLGGMLGGGGQSGLGTTLPGGGMLGGGLAGGRRTGGGGLQGALLGVLGGIAMNALQRRMQGAPTGAYRRRWAARRRRCGVHGAEFAPSSRQSGPVQVSPENAVMAARRARSGRRGSGQPARADHGCGGERRHADRRAGAWSHPGQDRGVGVGPDAQEFVLREMRSPMTLDQITREVSGPDVAAQAYAAALAAIDVDKPTERRFLAALAERTGLDTEVVNEIHDHFGQPRPGS